MWVNASRMRVGQYDASRMQRLDSRMWVDASRMLVGCEQDASRMLVGCSG